MTLVLVELEKLRTVRSTWLLFAAGALLPLPIAIVALAQVSDPATTTQDMVNLAAVPALVAGALAAVACAREFEHRTITVAFMLEPRRERVIVAKALAAMIVGVAMAALCAALTLGTTAIWISADGGAWQWSGGATAKAICGLLVISAVSAVAGTAFGAITRHVGGAITLLIAVNFVVEGVLAERFDVWRDYGLDAAGDALLEPAPAHAYGFPAGAAVMIGVGLVYLALGIAAVRRADV